MFGCFFVTEHFLCVLGSSHEFWEGVRGMILDTLTCFSPNFAFSLPNFSQSKGFTFPMLIKLDFSRDEWNKEVQ